MQRYMRWGLMLMLAFAWISAASAAEIQWIHSLDEGLAAAGSSQKPVMVESYTDT